MSTPKLAPPLVEVPAAAEHAKLPGAKIIPKSALELRAARRRLLQRRFGLWVGLPTLLAIIYYGFVATPQYDSSVSIAIESNEGRVSAESSHKGTTGNGRDAEMLMNALHSESALSAVDVDRTFHTHYTANGDWLTRLDADAGADTTLDYFRDHVRVHREPNSNVLLIHFRAFSGDVARQLADRLVEYSRTWVAHQNEQGATARLKMAKADVEREEQRLATATADLAKLGPDAPPNGPVAVEHEVAEKRLEVALGALQEAKLDVGRSERYLVVLHGPTLPDTMAAPKRGWKIASVGIGALVIVSVLSLLGAAVREHAKF